MKTLEQRIDAAAQAGDKRKLEALQAEYRSRGVVTRVTREPATIIEPRRKGPVSVDAFLARKPWSDRTAPRATSPRVKRVLFVKGLRSRLQTCAFAEEDGREAGGFLFGRLEGDCVVISDFSETGDAERSRDRIALDLDHALRWERADLIIGSWHTHDTRYGGAGPSRLDCEGSLRLAAKHPERIDVGVIVTPHPEYRWAAPLPTAYVAQLGKIEPVEIQEVEAWQ